MNCLRAARGGSMARYPNISDHGLIGDLQTAALVTDDGTVNWFCSPRFDSPSIFAALLDADKGGHFKIAPDRADYVTKQLYLPETAVLITRFMTPDGVGEVLDFMPIAYGRPTDRHRLVRQLRVPRGTMRFAMDLQPRFDYGRAQHTVDVTENGAVFHGDGGQELTLHTVGKRGAGKQEVTKLKRHGKGVRASWTLQEGESTGVVIETMGGQPKRLPPAELARLSDDTADAWRSWVERATYTGRGRGPPKARAAGRAGQAVRRHGRCVAQLGEAVDVYRAVAGDGGQVGHDAQAADLRAHRGAGRRGHHGAAGAGGRRA